MIFEFIYIAAFMQWNNMEVSRSEETNIFCHSVLRQKGDGFDTH